ncbi:chemotaxis protein CheW [Aquabacterium sp. J223]|uniref:chemotaxis protein CheW n=1 Tax=Aquabacterium sp. J223 TaxID=2898431 RepID=UPI0021AD5598|nr:chemotaxis protein CheW [Aquabacterium sp. J223]UUX95954.1 chemotaxis protein CheW [Aquabacterium sp. J223]
MSAAPDTARRAAPARCARVRIGRHEVAVPAEHVVQAVSLTRPPTPLPRRGGAIAGACDTPWGPIAVIDLNRWLGMGDDAAAPAQLVLLLVAGQRRIGVLASSLQGVLPVARQVRVHRDDDAEELFQSAVQWVGNAGLAALLEVQRLFDLAAVWGEDAGPPPRTVPATAPMQPHAIVRSGGRRWALPAACVSAVEPAVPLEFRLNDGSGVRGIGSWRGRKLPMVDLCALAGGPSGPEAAPLMAILTDGERQVAAGVDEVLQVARLPVPADGPDEPGAVFAPSLGPDGVELQRVAVDRLLRSLPEAEISRAPFVSVAGPRTAAAAAPRAGGRGHGAYLLFDNGGACAAPTGPVQKVLPLAPDLARRLADGEAVSVVVGDGLVPLRRLPALSGGDAVADGRVGGPAARRRRPGGARRPAAGRLGARAGGAGRRDAHGRARQGRHPHRITRRHARQPRARRTGRRGAAAELSGSGAAAAALRQGAPPSSPPGDDDGGSPVGRAGPRWVLK